MAPKGQSHVSLDTYSTMERRSYREISDELHLGVGPRKREGAAKRKADAKIVPGSKDEAGSSETKGAGKAKVAARFTSETTIEREGDGKSAVEPKGPEKCIPKDKSYKMKNPEKCKGVCPKKQKRDGQKKFDLCQTSFKDAGPKIDKDKYPTIHLEEFIIITNGSSVKEGGSCVHGPSDHYRTHLIGRHLGVEPIVSDTVPFGVRPPVLRTLPPQKPVSGYTCLCNSIPPDAGQTSRDEHLPHYHHLLQVENYPEKNPPKKWCEEGPKE